MILFPGSSAGLVIVFMHKFFREQHSSTAVDAVYRQNLIKRVLTLSRVLYAGYWSLGTVVSGLAWFPLPWSRNGKLGIAIPNHTHSKMHTGHPELQPEKINLIELCDSNSNLANELIANAYKYPEIQKKELDGIPANIIVNRPLSSWHLNRIVKIVGSIIKTYPVYFKNVTTEQLCLKCNNTVFLTEQELGKKKGLNICELCGSTNVKSAQNFETSFPTQSIRIQDMSNSGAMSETVEVIIEGAKAGTYHPGDKISVTGVVFRKWRLLRVNEPMLSSICLKSLQIVRESDDAEDSFEIKGLIDEFMGKNTHERRRFILDAFAPELFGMSNVKLGIVLSLVGGARETRDIGGSRGDSHILLVGDPGTGKSHLLKTAARLVSPAVFTNGVGTSDAGLTSCAVRQGKEWSLEAGALVLADTGICCIDEFNRLKVNEKSGLLESMEQQTLSIAKAGIVTSLNTRCSVFAASSTRHNYDLNKPVSENLRMSTPLISRFDLIFGLFDRGDRKSDGEISDQVLGRDLYMKIPESSRWSQSTLKIYISQCRKKKNKIDDGLCEILLRYYTRKKKSSGNGEFSTIRMLESLVRLSEAHSKLMNEDVVAEEDVFVSIMLMETSMNSTSDVSPDVSRLFVDEDYFNATKSAISKKYSLL